VVAFIALAFVVFGKSAPPPAGQWAGPQPQMGPWNSPPIGPAGQWPGQPMGPWAPPMPPAGQWPGQPMGPWMR
jgi:hypothetical protein